MIRNQYRQKCNEEIGREILEWEDIETAKAKQRMVDGAIATNNKKHSATGVALVPQATEEINKDRRSPTVRKIVADKVGFGEKKTAWLANSTRKINELRKQGYNGAADSLSNTLNKRSASSAQAKVKKLESVEKIMSELGKNHPTYSELEKILTNKDIDAAIKLTERYRQEVKNRDSKIQIGDVVKIVTHDQAHLNQWAIVAASTGDKEFQCDLLVHQETLTEVHKAELQKIEGLTEQEKKEAHALMHRLQAVWILSEKCPDDPAPKTILKIISTRNSPTEVTKLQKSLLETLEQKLKDSKK